MTRHPSSGLSEGNALKTIHGDDLIREVLRNMEEGLFRIGGKTLVPSIYRIYLHPDDYEPLRDVTRFIAEEIQRALDKQLAGWNRLRRLIPKKQATYLRQTDTWTVEIHPDLDGKLALHEVEIYSELGTPEKREYGAGSMTRRIFPRRETPEAPIPEAPIKEEAPTVSVVAPKPPAKIHACLRFADEKGPHIFEVTRNQIVIGRGGRSYWVDLKLETLPDVSREHCRIRRNPDTGHFTIEDVSQFGTFVNGKPVGQNAAIQLPSRATIGLAGVFELQWEAV
jgi:hypothetical protein